MDIKEEIQKETLMHKKNYPQKVINKIKTNLSNELIGSLSTQSSINNINNNSSSLTELNKPVKSNLNLPDLGYLENKEINLKSSHKKKIFDFLFENPDDFTSNAGDYLEEIYINLLEDEKNIFLKPKIGYMDMQNDINEQMRGILVDWLIEVHYRFGLRAETLHQTIWIIDTYLSIHPISRSRLQLLGIAGLLISCKSQEIYFPPLKEFIDITDGAYIKEDLLEMEKEVLKILNFNIVAPTSNEFYNIIAKAYNFDRKQYYLGKYFLESSLIDYQMLKYSSSVISVACIYIVMKFFGISSYKQLYSTDIIKESCPQKIIKDAAREICFLVKNLSMSSLKAAQNKYSLPQYLNVVQYCQN